MREQTTIKGRAVFSKLESSSGPSLKPALVPALLAACYGVMPINSFFSFISSFFLQTAGFAAAKRRVAVPQVVQSASNNLSLITTVTGTEAQ